MKDGYGILPEVFAPAEIASFVATLGEQLTTRSRAGARHLLRTPAVRQLATDRRLTELASDWIGDDAYPFRATLFDKSADANWLVVWHQDTALPLRRRFEAPGWGPWSTKGGVPYAHAPVSALERIVALRVHLDDNTSVNGPLRVLPQTHTLGLLSDAQIEVLSREIPPVQCVATAGSVVAMRPLLVHSSSKSREDRRRRVLHIEYAVGEELGPGVQLAEG
jgi:ectoine hydroxylase-related dioxygenase (phytanoyl-CoA dioxygenase family)